jgi:UDP-N-acetyl-D-glucosamine dehydrogenase
MHKKIIKKIKERNLIIGVIGLGYVGLPIVIKFSLAGFKVIGIDTDIEKVDLLNNGKSYLHHFKNKEIKLAQEKGFKATQSFEEINNIDFIILCLPTPIKKNKAPDLSYIVSTMKNISPYLKKGQSISLESTSYPGTTEEEVLPYLEKKKFKIGNDFFLIYSPEREDPGNKKFNINNIPKIVSGLSKNCLEIGDKLYSTIVNKTVRVEKIKTAELAKLLENIYRSVNIGLVNEMKMIADKMKINITDVISAAATKPFGFTAFYPGPGIGGHCIPVDPFYLSWKARKFNIDAKFIELAGKINSSIPDWVVRKISSSIKERGKRIENSNILIIGISYKEDVDDLRESPSLVIIDKLRKKGVKINYYDPYISKIPKTRNYNFDLKSIELSKKKVSFFDAVVICTAHTNVNYDLIKKSAKLIIDTRNVYKIKSKKIVKA